MESDRRLTLNEIHTGHLEQPMCEGQTNRRGASCSHSLTPTARRSHLNSTDALYMDTVSPMHYIHFSCVSSVSFCSFHFLFKSYFFRSCRCVDTKCYNISSAA